MIEIDGSYGEGGGQILRTSLSLSCLTGQPFRIVNIRKGREKPGLMPQHLVAVRAARMVSGAVVSGDEKGSTELTFSPDTVRSGDFDLDIGTAGSIPLVLQTVIPPLLFAGGGSRVTLQGGTHVPFSPSFHYLAEVFAPMLARLGVELRFSIKSYGFYPRGGGRVTAEIKATAGLRPFNPVERGELLRLHGYSAVGNLPLSIAERQRDAAMELIRERIRGRLPLEVNLLNVPTPGKGTFVFLLAEYENVRSGFTSLGALGKRAEAVGEEAAREFISHHATGAALDPHLADQFVLYLALAEGESSFTTSAITEHLLTSLWAVARFHPCRYSAEGSVGEPGRVRINISG
jgi:RNA 3'-terminal phosphate cyclase (ATP)